MENKYLRKVRAIFNPDDLSNVRPELYEDVGKEFIFQYSWIMGMKDMYPGIWALISHEETFSGFGLWVPEFDLNIIEEVNMSWKEIRAKS